MIDLVGSISDAMMAQNVRKHTIKTEVDLDRYQRIIDATDPAVIIETGTCAGGSAAWFADNSRAKVITVDVDPKVSLDMWKMWDYRVYPIAGSSVAPEIFAEVLDQVRRVGPDPRTMVVLDSDHAANHVVGELELYAPLVTPGCYLVVEDTLVRWMPWTAYVGSPLDAVEKFMVSDNGDEWLIDMAVENLHERTQHPMGWLRRLPHRVCGEGNNLSEETAWPCLRPRHHNGNCEHLPPPAEFRSILDPEPARP